MVILVIALANTYQIHRKALLSNLTSSQDNYKRLGNLADDSPIVLYRFQLKPFHKLLYANKTSELMTGYPLEVLYADDAFWQNLVHPEDIEKVRGMDLNKPLIVRWIKQDGNTIWIEHHPRTIMENGEVVAIEGTIWDITSRKKLEEELAEHRKTLERRVSSRTAQLETLNEELSSTNDQLEMKNIQLEKEVEIRKNLQKKLALNELKFRSFIQQSSEGIALINDNGKVLEWNQTMEELFEINKNDAIDNYIWEIEHLVLPQNKEERNKLINIKKEIENLLVNNPDHKLITQLEHTIQPKSGKIKHLSLTIFEIETQMGRFFGRVTRDISYEKEKEEQLARYQNYLESQVEKRTEALKVSKENYRIIFEQAADAIFLGDVKGNVLAMNKKAALLTGYSPTELLGKDSMILFDPESIEKKPFRYDLVLGGENVIIERNIVTKDGTTVPIEMNSCLLSNQQIQILMRDLSERKKVEESLKNSEEKFSKIFKYNHSIIILMDLETAAIIDANDEALALFGFEKDQALGKTSNELGVFTEEKRMELWEDLVEKSYFEAQELVIHKKSGEKVFCITYGEKIEVGGKEVGLIQAHNITQIKTVEKDLLAKNKALKAAEEELLATIEEHQAANDELELRNKELRDAVMQLKNNEEKYRMLYEHNYDAVILMKGTEFYDCNTKAEKLFGVKKGVFEHKPPFLFSPKHQPDGQLSTEKAIQILNGQLPPRFEWLHQKEDDTLLYCEITVSAFEYSEQKYSQVIIRDITEKKLAEEELTHKNQLIENIRKGVSSKVGKVFFETVASQTAKVIKADFTYVGELIEHDDPAKVQVKTIAFWQEGHVAENFTYDLEGSPCQGVFKKQMSMVYPSDVAAQFPKDLLLTELEVEAYVGTPLCNSKGKPVGIIVAMSKKMLQDTKGIMQVLEIFSGRAGAELEKLKIDRALLESEERFRSTFEQAAVGIIHLKPDGSFGKINKRFCDIVGYTQEELLKKDFRSLTHPDDLKSNIDIFQQLLKREIQDISFEKRYIHKKGHTVWVNLTTTHLYNPDNTPKYALTIVEDITRRKNAELELERYQNTLESLVEERTGQIQKLNDELTSKNIQLGDYNQNLVKQKAELEQILKTLKSTQSQLVQSEKMASLGVLTAGIAHEINNPVNFISSGLQGLKLAIKNIIAVLHKYEAVDQEHFTEQIEEIEKLKEEVKFTFLLDNLEKISRNMENGVIRTSEIIKGLRTFSRPDKGEPIPTNIHDNLDSALTILHHQYKYMVGIEKDYGDIQFIDCYPSELNQVFINILGNAIQALTEKVEKEKDFKATILISTSLTKNKKYVLIKIKDNGNGIPKASIKKIFEPFYTTKDVGKGTGLGLSISYSIIQKHKGEIQVDSQEGKGSEFIISLPVSQ
ncbi:PAS domain S-box protein [Flammeovirgaceae bacterium SG7u.111]|nr:PAS domain S-box protein [Flammeovirgaceae bacterium SG7u.132]WPO36637.1 PAS domain S-box protein [Flammeovirgaceae bacterium SG7u.111]